MRVGSKRDGYHRLRSPGKAGVASTPLSLRDECFGKTESAVGCDRPVLGSITTDRNRAERGKHRPAPSVVRSALSAVLEFTAFVPRLRGQAWLRFSLESDRSRRRS